MGGGGTFPTPFKITFASLATFARTGSPTIPEKDAEAVGHPKQQRTHRLFSFLAKCNNDCKSSTASYLSNIVAGRFI